MLKFILVVLLLAMLVSLAMALKSLFNPAQADDAGTFNWLRIRIALALAILVVVCVGFYTGDLSISAPWLGRY